MEETCEEVTPPRNGDRRRNSIMREKPEEQEDFIRRRSKRVSFAGTQSIKEFMLSKETGTEWNQTYEEPLMSSSSSMEMTHPVNSKIFSNTKDADFTDSQVNDVEDHGNSNFVKPTVNFVSKILSSQETESKREFSEKLTTEQDSSNFESSLRTAMNQTCFFDDEAMNLDCSLYTSLKPEKNFICSNPEREGKNTTSAEHFEHQSEDNKAVIGLAVSLAPLTTQELQNEGFHSLQMKENTGRLAPIFNDDVTSRVPHDINEDLTCQVSQSMKDSVTNRVLHNEKDDLTCRVPIDLDDDLTCQVPCNIKNNLTSRVSHFVNDDLTCRVPTDLNDDLTCQVPFNIKENLTSRVPHVINEDLTCQVSQSMKDSVTNRVLHNEEDDLTCRVPIDLDDDLTCQVLCNIKDNLTSRVIHDVNDDLTCRVPTDLNDDLTCQVPCNIKENLTSRVPHDINEELTCQVSLNIKENMITHAPYDINDDLTCRVPQDLDDDLTCQVLCNVKKNFTTEAHHDVNDELKCEFSNPVKNITCQSGLKDDLPCTAPQDLKREVTCRMAVDLGDDLTPRVSIDVKGNLVTHSKSNMESKLIKRGDQIGSNLSIVSLNLMEETVIKDFDKIDKENINYHAFNLDGADQISFALKECQMSTKIYDSDYNLTFDTPPKEPSASFPSKKILLGSRNVPSKECNDSLTPCQEIILSSAKNIGDKDIVDDDKENVFHYRQSRQLHPYSVDENRVLLQSTSSNSLTGAHLDKPVMSPRAIVPNQNPSNSVGLKAALTKLCREGSMDLKSKSLGIAENEGNVNSDSNKENYMGFPNTILGINRSCYADNNDNFRSEIVNEFDGNADSNEKGIVVERSLTGDTDDTLPMDNFVLNVHKDQTESREGKVHFPSVSITAQHAALNSDERERSPKAPLNISNKNIDITAQDGLKHTERSIHFSRKINETVKTTETENGQCHSVVSEEKCDANLALPGNITQADLSIYRDIKQMECKAVVSDNFPINDTITASQCDPQIIRNRVENCTGKSIENRDSYFGRSEALSANELQMGTKEILLDNSSVRSPKKQSIVSSEEFDRSVSENLRLVASFEHPKPIPTSVKFPQNISTSFEPSKTILNSLESLKTISAPVEFPKTASTSFEPSKTISTSIEPLAKVPRLDVDTNNRSFISESEPDEFLLTDQSFDDIKRSIWLLNNSSFANSPLCHSNNQNCSQVEECEPNLRRMSDLSRSKIFQNLMMEEQERMDVKTKESPDICKSALNCHSISKSILLSSPKQHQPEICSGCSSIFEGNHHDLAPFEIDSKKDEKICLQFPKSPLKLILSLELVHHLIVKSASWEPKYSDCTKGFSKLSVTILGSLVSPTVEKLINAQLCGMSIQFADVVSAFENIFTLLNDLRAVETLYVTKFRNDGLKVLVSDYKALISAHIDISLFPPTCGSPSADPVVKIDPCVKNRNCRKESIEEIIASKLARPKVYKIYDTIKAINQFISSKK